MLCTIKYESNFYERASNHNKNGSVDYGLFQVNSTHLGDSGCPSSSSSLYNAATNTKCALHIYKSQGINAWYGYQKHRTECNGYRAPSTASAPPATAPDAPAADNPSPSPSPTGPTPSPTPDGGADCYSGTLEEIEPAGTCVESKFGSGGWFQCHDGKWYSGGDTGTGPYGACTSIHPLP